MKKLALNLMICLAFLSMISMAQAQSNEALDEIRDLCTELIVSSSQTSSSAHRVIVFTQNGNSRQLERAINSTGSGLGEVVEQLGRLRRIANGIISNQRAETGNAYRSRGGWLSGIWGRNSRDPQDKAAVALEIKSLMGMIKDLSQEIRAEVMQIKNSRD